MKFRVDYQWFLNQLNTLLDRHKDDPQYWWIKYTMNRYLQQRDLDDSVLNLDQLKSDLRWYQRQLDEVDYQLQIVKRKGEQYKTQINIVLECIERLEQQQIGLNEFLETLKQTLNFDNYVNRKGKLQILSATLSGKRK